LIVERRPRTGKDSLELCICAIHSCHYGILTVLTLFLLFGYNMLQIEEKYAIQQQAATGIRAAVNSSTYEKKVI